MSIRLASILRVASRYIQATSLLALKEKVRLFVEEGLYSDEPEVVLNAIKSPRLNKWGIPLDDNELIRKISPSLLKDASFLESVIQKRESNVHSNLYSVLLRMMLPHWVHDFSFLVDLCVRHPSVIGSIPNISKDLLLSLLKHPSSPKLEEGLSLCFVSNGRYLKKDEDILLEMAMHYPNLFNEFAPTNIKHDPDFLAVLGKGR